MDNWGKKLNYLSLYTAQDNKSCLAKYKQKKKKKKQWIELEHLARHIRKTVLKTTCERWSAGIMDWEPGKRAKQPVGRNCFLCLTQMLSRLFSDVNGKLAKIGLNRDNWNKKCFLSTELIRTFLECLYKPMETSLCFFTVKKKIAGFT